MNAGPRERDIAVPAEQAAQRVASGYIERALVPALITGLGFLLLRGINGIDDDIAELRNARASDQATMTQMRNDVLVLTTKLDYSVIKRVDELDERMKRIEQATQATR